MIIAYAFLLCSAISVLFLCEDSIAVGMLLGLCLLFALRPLLPDEWVEALPMWRNRGLSLRNGWSPRCTVGALVALAIGYPIAAFLLYPLRDRLMAAFDRRYGRGR